MPLKSEQAEKFNLQSLGCLTRGANKKIWFVLSCHASNRKCTPRNRRQKLQGVQKSRETRSLGLARSFVQDSRRRQRKREKGLQRVNYERVQISLSQPVNKSPVQLHTLFQHHFQDPLVHSMLHSHIAERDSVTIQTTISSFFSFGA